MGTGFGYRFASLGDAKARDPALSADWHYKHNLPLAGRGPVTIKTWKRKVRQAQKRGDKVALTRLMMQRPGGPDEEIEAQERLTRTIEQGERPRA